MYYFIRSLAIKPAAMAGDVFWKITPPLRFLVAGAVGFVGTVFFAMTVEERFAG